MRVVMMGTGPFAVPTLRRLYDSRHEVVALFTRPVRELHGKSQAEANPMRETALARGTTVHDPESINEPHARSVLASYHPELLVVCDYGQILAPRLWRSPALAASICTRHCCRSIAAQAPINWAIYHGETETGVTIIHMTPRVDAGPAIAQAATPIGERETAAELEPRLAELGAPLVLESIEAIESGTSQALPQDPALATRAPRLKKELGLVDWSRSAAAIANQVRALQPWPKTYSFWQRPAGEPLRLILDGVHVEPASGSQAGVVLEAAGDRLVIGTGQNAVVVDSIQPAGKRVLSAAEFLRGYPVQPGERFGSSPVSR